MNNNHKQTLDWLKDRATQLNGRMPDGLTVGASLKNTLDEISKQSEQESIDFLKAAATDPDKQRQLNEVRVFQIGTYVLPKLVWGRFFEIEVLGEADQAVLYNDSKTEITVGYIGDANKPKTIRVEPESTSSLIELKYLSTERVRFKVMDLMRGRIDDVAQRNFDLAFDMANKIDELQYTLLSTASGSGGAYGAFTTTGVKSARSYIKNSRVIASYLPSTNDVNVGTPSTVTKFGVSTLDEIAKYANAWGDSFADGPLRPTGEIIMPPSDIEDIDDDITTTVASNVFTDDVMKGGYYNGVAWKGIPWKFTPVNTIPIGTCYPIFNKPVGKLFLKPSMDKYYKLESDRYPHLDPNYAEEYVMKVVGFAIPSNRRLNTARFTYKTEE